MTHLICWHCENRYAFGNDDLCVVCRKRQNHYNMIASTVEKCNSLDESILSNISEYQIENNYRLTDGEVKSICELRNISSEQDLRECDQLFLQLHHNNEMVI